MKKRKEEDAASKEKIRMQTGKKLYIFNIYTTKEDVNKKLAKHLKTSSHVFLFS